MTTHTDPIGRPLGTRLHPHTHEVLHREKRPHLYVSEQGAKVVADIPGWYPDSDGEPVHTPDDDKAKALAAAALKALDRGFAPTTHTTAPAPDAHGDEAVPVQEDVSSAVRPVPAVRLWRGVP